MYFFLFLGANGLWNAEEKNSKGKFFFFQNAPPFHCKFNAAITVHLQKFTQILKDIGVHILNRNKHSAKGVRHRF